MKAKKKQPAKAWYGVTADIDCPSPGCKGKNRTVKTFATATGNDPDASVRGHIVSSPPNLSCPGCGAAVAPEVEVTYRVERGTPARLRRKGYPIPRGIK